jgi:predicted DNA binding CopG/RHH family protein
MPENKKTKRINIRVSEYEWKRIQQESAKLKVTPTRYAKLCVSEAIRKKHDFQ